MGGKKNKDIKKERMQAGSSVRRPNKAWTYGYGPETHSLSAVNTY